MSTSSSSAGAASAESYVWPLLFLLAVILPQLVVPTDLRVGPPRVVPLAEMFLLAVLVVIALRPGPVPRGARPLVLVLTALLVLANILAAGHLVLLSLTQDTVHGVTPTATRLLITGVMVLATNTVTFGLLYWQVDGGGPNSRVETPGPYADLCFPQTGDPTLSGPGWMPMFVDYLYVAFTNVVAFSPTDTMPLTRRAKGLMTLQSLVSLSVIVVVLARVINILPGN